MSTIATPVETKSRVLWTPLARVTLLLGCGAILGTVLGAITGEKTTFLFKDQLHLSASVRVCKIKCARS